MKAGLKVSMKVGLKVEDLCGRVYLWRIRKFGVFRDFPDLNCLHNSQSDSQYDGVRASPVFEGGLGPSVVWSDRRALVGR